MTGGGWRRPKFRHIAVLTVVLALRSGTAEVVRYLKPGGQASTPVVDNRETNKGSSLEHNDHQV